MTHCTHGYPAMHHLKVGDTCAICNTIVTVVASPATTGSGYKPTGWTGASVETHTIDEVDPEEATR